VQRESDGKYFVVDGHGRLQAAKELGYKKIPVREYIEPSDTPSAPLTNERQKFIAQAKVWGRKEMLKLSRKWGFAAGKMNDDQLAEALWNLKQRSVKHAAGLKARSDTARIAGERGIVTDRPASRYAYATAAKGYGYRMALMGFDFTDLEEKRRKFQWWLESQGVDSETAYSEAMRLDHSWEFAAYKQGKAYMDALDPWLGALDMTPGSVGLRLYAKYKAVRGHSFPDHEGRPGLVGGSGAEQEAQRNHSAAESRTNFTLLKDIYSKDAVRLSIALRTYITQARDALTQLVERQAQQGPLSAEFAQSVRVNTGHEFQNAVEAYLMDVWRRNRDAAIAELPEKVRVKLQGMKRYGEWDESKHPRQPAGSEAGGEFVSAELYHGTTQENADYIAVHGWQTGQRQGGIAVGSPQEERSLTYLSPKKAVAQWFAKQNMHNKSPAVVPVHFTGRILRVEGAQTIYDAARTLGVKQDENGYNFDDFRVKLKAAGYQAVAYRDAWAGKKESIAVFDPSALQSVQRPKKHEDHQDYAVAFRPDIASNYFHNRALLIKGIVDDELTRDAKFSIFETLKGGRTMNEAMGDLRSIFEPWIGDPTKIEPSGISQTEADVLKPYRLENIIRTESTTAIAQGRAAVADAAADFVVGFEHSSILDDRTTEVCQLADGITFKKDDPRAVKLQPPLHFNCRSIDTFVTSDDDVEWTSEEDLDAVVRLIQPEFK
jgi:SPP1 gp7 family putative phage head morphogenesis protein